MARPAASTREVAERMSRVQRRDTAPELALRRELHRRGLRYRVDSTPAREVKTRADILFVGSRVAVFVDGCFWHGCPDHGVLPKANRAWWLEKLRSNTARDTRVDSALHDLGWEVIRVWEHEEKSEAADRVEASVKWRSSSDGPPSPRETDRDIGWEGRVRSIVPTVFWRALPCLSCLGGWDQGTAQPRGLR